MSSGAVYYTLVGVYSAFALTSIIFFVINRSKEPIKSRGLELSITSAFVAILYFIFFSAVQVELDSNIELNCDIISWLYTIFLPLWVTPYILRGEIVVFQYWYNMGKLNETTSRYTSYRRKSTKRRFHFLIYFAFVIFNLILTIIIEYSVSSPSLGNSVRRCLSNHTYLVAAQGIFYILVVIFFMFALWKAKDTYAIRTELFILLCVSVPIYVMFGVILFFGEFFSSLKSTWFLIILMFLCVCISIDFPLVMCYINIYIDRKGIHTGEKKVNEEFKSEEFFRITLENSTLLESFKQFSVECWCTENVLFYSEVNQFKLEPNYSDANRIYKTFIKLGADLEVNIDETTRHIIQDTIESQRFAIDTFDEAQKVVYNQLRYDVFPKWITSTRFGVAFEKSGLRKSETLENIRSSKKLIRPKSKAEDVELSIS